MGPELTVTNAEREMLLSPTSTNCVQIRGANSTCLDLDIDIIISKWLWNELVLVELCPFLWIEDLEPDEL